MTNAEKYRDEIIRANKNFCKDFVRVRVLTAYGLECKEIVCSQCHVIMGIWLKEEYKEPDIDWTQVPVDTLVEVWHTDNQTPTKRYFAEFDNGEIYCWRNGATSITADNNEVYPWEYGRIVKAEVEE